MRAVIPKPSVLKILSGRTELPSKILEKTVRRTAFTGWTVFPITKANLVKHVMTTVYNNPVVTRLRIDTTFS